MRIDSYAIVRNTASMFTSKTTQYVSRISYSSSDKKLFFDRNGPDVITWPSEEDAQTIVDMFPEYDLRIICYTQ